VNPYLKEVIDLHVLIEALFARGEPRIESMLARFHPDFSMVTPTGLQIDRQAVEQLFTQRSKTQPGLTIELTDLRGLEQGADSATVLYRETHRLPAQAAKTRISTALLILQEGDVLWRHLHETWAA